MLTLTEVRSRLTVRLRDKVRSGELTERALARATGVSQPHIHHVLKGKRSLSITMADSILTALELDVLDLMQPDECAESIRRHGEQTSAAVN